MLRKPIIKSPHSGEVFLTIHPSMETPEMILLRKPILKSKRSEDLRKHISLDANTFPHRREKMLGGGARGAVITR